MIYATYTKSGIGAQIWGTYDDLRTFYEIIEKFWNITEFQHIGAFENRNELIRTFSYEVRKSMNGQRLSRRGSWFSQGDSQLYGFEISWVHLFFSLAALKENWNFIPPNKLDLSFFYSLEHWLELALDEYDISTAHKIKPYLQGSIYGENPYMYQFMCQLNENFFSLGKGKQAFRKLPELLRASSYATVEFNELNDYIEEEAKRLDGKPNQFKIPEIKEFYIAHA
ncbi:hypothetical protein ORI89_12165 [Sphingobacterium sp. UT-1RO-CII-1]|uniref:DUF6904 family protein n=1 Tax=Sphingobacterium sp. UT-1RO-CII-1 TaxID=2995225 RepID=UPI00227C3C49|nr:hypothetical protein [Sphingobacterium sp. UT-1RO-CII-1]MCY4780410.1 hypothetical protein [Sphingobacterium sp. UT-1RO-CII-1]